jgi:hypothetical protein
VSGYTFNKVYLNGDVTVFWTPPANPNDENAVIDMAVKAKTLGYGAVGFSRDGNMIGSDAVIGWIDNNANEDVKAYELTGKSPDLVIESTKLVITDTSAAEENGFTIIKFKRKIKNNGNVNFDVTGQNSKLIVAIGTNDNKIKHSDKQGSITLNFLTGESTAGVDGLQILKYIHAVLMFTSWGIILPLGGFLARYRPHPCGGDCLWWPHHENLQWTGIIMSSGGYVIAYFMVGGSHFSTGPDGNIVHATIGTIITFFALVQFFMAIARPHQPTGYKKSEVPSKPEWRKPTCSQACRGESETEDTPWRLIWERKHRWFGRILFMTAAVNISIGARLLAGSFLQAIAIIFYLYLGYLLIQIIIVIYMDSKFRKWLCCKSSSETFYTFRSL